MCCKLTKEEKLEIYILLQPKIDQLVLARLDLACKPKQVASLMNKEVRLRVLLNKLTT